MNTNIEVIKQLYQLFAANDRTAIKDLFSDGIEWKQMKGFPQGGVFIGPDSVFTSVFDGLRHKWRHWEAIVTEYLDAGHDIIATGYYEGIYRPTGKYVKADFAHRYTVSGGKITRFVQYTDTHLVAKAMEDNRYSGYL
jgi:ketosteroid isomerase-like protein